MCMKARERVHTHVSERCLSAVSSCAHTRTHRQCAYPVREREKEREGGKRERGGGMEKETERKTEGERGGGEREKERKRESE